MGEFLNPGLGTELKDYPMEALRAEKMEMYKELEAVSLGYDFLNTSFEDLRKAMELLSPRRSEVRWYLKRIVDLIKAQEHRITSDDIADSEQATTLEFLNTEKNKLQRLLNLYA